MALMSFREPNQVKWQGVRPGHNGTQVTEYDSATNGNTSIYLVPAGKTLFLCSVMLGYSAIATGRGNLEIWDTTPAFWWRCLADFIVVGQSAFSHVSTYWPPLEVPAGYQMIIGSNVAGLTAHGGIFGWVE